MTRAVFEAYGLGLFKVFWRDGGYSLCAIGQRADGGRWLAPVNWLSPTDVDAILLRDITRVVRIA